MSSRAACPIRAVAMSAGRSLGWDPSGSTVGSGALYGQPPNRIRSPKNRFGMRCSICALSMPLVDNIRFREYEASRFHELFSSFGGC